MTLGMIEHVVDDPLCSRWSSMKEGVVFVLVFNVVLNLVVASYLYMWSIRYHMAPYESTNTFRLL